MRQDDDKVCCGDGLSHPNYTVEDGTAVQYLLLFFFSLFEKIK